MSNRHLARTVVMQTLYEWDFHGQQGDRIEKAFERNQEELVSDTDDRAFGEALLSGVREHLPAIDEMIKVYAPEWPIEQITIVDRNILRVGVYELVYAEEIPSKVAINEAIEIAKAFGGESSGRFVNGVLGAIYRDRVSQGKMKKVDLEEKPKTERKQNAAAGKSSSPQSS